MIDLSRFKFKSLLMTSLVIASMFLHSCSDDDPAPVTAGKEGFFIVNQGNFGARTASLSYFDRDANTVANYVYKTKNGDDLGDQAQSMTLFENKGYIVMQNDGEVEIINADDFSDIGTIDVPSPRYFVGISSTKAYVSDWGADGITGTVQVIDLSTNEVTKTIPTGQGANRMLKVGNLVYVTNNGGYGKDNTITIIDSNTDEVADEITVGDNPNGIVRDAGGNIWVTSGGFTDYGNSANSTKASLSKIGANNTEVFRLELDANAYPSIDNITLSKDGNAIFYTYNGKVYKMATTATSLPTTAFLEKNYYSIAVDPFTGNLLGGGEDTDYVTADNLDMIDSSTGEVIETFEVGIAPAAYAFK